MNLILIIGATGQGKSYFLNKVLLQNQVIKKAGKDAYYPTHQSRYQYVFDLNDEYQFKDDTTGLFKQTRHIDYDMETFIKKAAALKCYNIIFEDATGFLRGRQQPEIIKQIISKRHTGNNYIMLFHAIENVPPELMRIANFVFIFKTGDNLHSINKKFHNDKLNLAFAQVQRQKNFTHQLIKIV